MTEETNVVTLPTAEQRKQNHLAKLRGKVVGMLQEILQNPPAHALIITLSPSDEDPTQDELNVASTLPLNSKQDVEGVIHIIYSAADAIINALKEPNAESVAEDGE